MTDPTSNDPLRTPGPPPTGGFSLGSGDTPFRSRPFVLEDLVKQTLDDRYVIDELLGMGGMGAVFRARQTRLRRTVALKVPKPELCKNADFLARFEREALTMAKLVHQNIVQIFDVSVSPIIAVPSFIVMEFVEGVELDKFLIQQERDLTVEAVLDLFLQIGDGLDAAHARGIVHRDIKPANIVVTMPQRLAKIMDFGIAKTASMENAFQTMEAQAIGTPAFMAPEQIEGKAVTPAADIYAFAIMVYRLLSRQSPFQATSISALMMAHIQEPPAPITTLMSTLPPGLDAALAKGLEKDPEKRWTSAGELALAISRALEPVRSKCFADLFGPLNEANATARAQATTQPETGTMPPRRDTAHLATPAPTATGHSAAARRARTAGTTPAPGSLPPPAAAKPKSRSMLPLILVGVVGVVILLGGVALAAVLYINFGMKKPDPKPDPIKIAGTTGGTTTGGTTILETPPVATPIPRPTPQPTAPPATPVAAVSTPLPQPTKAIATPPPTPRPATPTPPPTPAPPVVIVQAGPSPTPIVIYVTPTPGPAATVAPATPVPVFAFSEDRPIIDSDPRWLPASNPPLTDEARIKRLKREAGNYFGDRIQRPLFNGLIGPEENDLATAGEDARTLMHRVNDMRSRAQNVSLQIDIRPESLFWENQMELVVDWRVTGVRALRSSNTPNDLLTSRTPMVMRLERANGSNWRLAALKAEVPRAGQ